MRSKMAKLMVAGSVVLALAGCASGPSPEEEFASAVRADLETSYSDSELVAIAQDACDAVADGGGQQTLTELLLDSGLSPQDYGVVAGHGVNHLCTDQREAFQDLFGGSE